MNPSDTIAALATVPGPSLRAVVRVSGEEAVTAARAVFTPDDAAAWDACRVATRFEGHVNLDGVAVPAACQLWPTSRSYTGQPSAELHLPGGDVLSGLILEQLQAVGVRPAGRGEFTLRAFLAGRLDLAQAEAVLGVIDAEDSEELADALSQLAGGVRSSLAKLHDALMIDLADLEAGLDFADEDLDFVSREAFAERLGQARASIDACLRQTQTRATAGAAETVVLSGPPNAGKSTLFNRLTGLEAALVSDVAGTTRDYLTGSWRIGGRTVRLIDTAGEDDSEDRVAAAAERQRQAVLAEASLVLHCGRHVGDLPAEANRDPGPPTLRVQTMRDLGGPEAADAIAVSAADGTGLDALAEAVGVTLEADRSGRTELLATTAARSAAALRTAAESVRRAEQLNASAAGDELVAEELRRTLTGLADVLGRVYTDDILDRVFSRFCIGK